MARRHTQLLLCLVLVGPIATPALAGDGLVPPKPTARAVDPAKVKAQKLEKQRLLTKLQNDVPKLIDLRSGSNPLEARSLTAMTGPDRRIARRVRRG